MSSVAVRAASVLACLTLVLAPSTGLGATFQGAGLYQSFDQLTTWASSFAAANSDIVQLVEYGRSAQNRPLLALQLSEHPGINDPAKPEFLFTGGLHAREVIGSQSAYELAEYLVNGYRTGDLACLGAINNREVWIVPNQNPDGRVSVEGGNSQQRKNMQLYPGQYANSYARGVDLNRNYPHRWINASASVSDETYRGPYVLSEPEAAGLWAMLHDRSKFSNLLASIDFHSGAQTILSPWTSSGDTLNPPPAPVRAKLDSLATKMGQLTGLSTARLGYDSYGTLADSLYEEFGSYSFIEELYQGSGDYFTIFNPITATTRDATVNKALDSAMYMLSDEAFVVPEPGTLVLLVIGVAGLVSRRWLRRIGCCHWRRVGLVLAFCLPGVLVERACAALYTVGDLSPSNFTESYVCAAAGTGQVGWGYNAATSYRGHALLWNGSATAVDLNPTGFTQSYAYGASGTQQVGYGYRPAVHALLWNGTAANYVDLNPTNFTQSYALATDGTRQVGYGYGSPTNSRTHALLWSGTAASYMDLNPSGFLVSEAWGIAGAQQVGNGYTATDSRRHALLWSSTVSAVDLNPSGFTESFAWATNSARQVGQASGPSTNNLPHAMLWSGYAASAMDLTPPGCYQSVARGINGLHQVGFATGAATGYASHAMLWSGSAASALDLNQFLPSGLGNSSATAIDAQGNIAGQAVDASGKTHAVLWQLVAGAWLGGTGGNDWASPANWNAATITAIPDAPGEKIALGNAGAAPTINLAGADRTVGQVVFNSNVGTNIVTTGQHRLKLDNGSDPALITAAGTHAITAPMTLTSNLTVTTTAASDSLSLLGGIGGAKGLSKAGAGTLTLDASNTYTGGTTVLGGTLAISQADAMPVGGSLTIGAGGSLVLQSGLSADTGASGAALGGGTAASTVSASIVPEPGTLVLLAALAAASLAWRANGSGVKRSGMHHPRLQS